MDSLDFELMEPLSYNANEDDYLEKSLKKRPGTVDIEDATRGFKRQRVDKNAPVTSFRKEINSDKSVDSFPIEVISDVISLEDDSDSSRILKSQYNLDYAAPSCVFDNASHINPSNPALSINQEPTSSTSTAVACKTGFRRVLKRIPNDIPYLPLTCEDGSRLYLRIKDVNEDAKTNYKTSLFESTQYSGKNLINDWDRTKAEAKLLKDKFHKELTKTVERDMVSIPSEENKENESGASNELWVEKYKPKSFLDLLSQEAVNRALLHWIKLWDKSVFGFDYLAKVKATREKYSKLEAQEKEKDERFQRKPLLPISEEYDDGGRPSVKVVLLSGDPGLGKTTCAHIIARHAGYNIREVNASDDRSIEIFRKVIDDSTQSRSETFQGGRPNCLIIDEIDGAPLASVNVLVELITGNATESGKKKIKKVLRRPVICICNDLYATSLKLLKKYAFILQFPSIAVPRLIERLNEVSAHESLFLDSNTIRSLCHKSDCDVRSCLSTLQFLKRKRCTPKDALFAQIGMKDKSKGIFSVWGDIFTLPEEKKYQDSQDPGKSDIRFRNILRCAQNYGEYEKVFGGVFENYLNVKYRDSYLQTVMEGLEWSTWFEEIRGYIERTQTYGMFGYLPMYFVMSHFLYARRDSPRIRFPNTELVTKYPKFKHTIKAQIAEAPVSVARFLDPYMLITDVYPAILNIIQPCNIRPVPTQIWTPKERETLKNVVEVMLAFNLSYSQTKNPETGAYSFVLEPDLEDMVKFQLQDSISNKKPFPYAIKQLVSREIETEKLRRNDMIPDVVRRDSFKLPETPKSSKSKPPDAVNKSAVTVARDFFGRPILTAHDASPEMESKKQESAAVYFRFKEGFSNAVRRYVKTRDLC